MSKPLQDEQDNLLESLPESHVQAPSKFSIVWLIPLIAILIAVWIAYQAWSKMGPTITISFETADGLEAGKTKIKYKNVEIGQVQTIRLNHETKAVEVSAELNKDFQPFLTDKTRFWVVRARVDVSGVSGLETLLSGAYIGVDPNQHGAKMRQFTGLEIPPVVTGNTAGKHFILHSESLGSIERDVPIYYRKFNVGRVEDVQLNDDGKSVAVRIFVRAPFDQWVNQSTKFWNASGIDFSMHAGGINMDTESLVSILIGGIAFESSDLSETAIQASNNTNFKLYPNRMATTLTTHYHTGLTFVINFSESLRGLSIGAPLEFRGIQLGEVTDIQLEYDASKKKMEVPVTVTIDYDRIALKGDTNTPAQLYTSHEERTNYFIKQGLRAQLQTANLLTGQLYIEIDFFPTARPFLIDWDADTPEFPAIPGTLGLIKHDIPSILKKVDMMMTQVKELTYTLNHTVAPEMSKTLKQAERSLVSIESTLKNDSPIQQELQSTLQELSKAARSIKNLTDYLERHPESLIQGKEDATHE